MEDTLDIDSPLAHYKSIFPHDAEAEKKVMNLLLNTAGQVTGKYYNNLDNIEQDGLSRLELDIYTNIKIDALGEPEMV